MASGGAVNSGGTVASGGALNSGGTTGSAIVVNSGGTAGSGGASGAPSATPSGQRLLGGGSEIWAINFAELKLLHVVGEGSFGRVRAQLLLACLVLGWAGSSWRGSARWQETRGL